jgi:hypothetical protein
MKIEIDEATGWVVVSDYSKESRLTPRDMQKILAIPPHVNHFIIRQMDFISFYKDRTVTFLPLERSFDTVSEVSAEIDKFGFKFAPLFDMFTINFMEPDFQKTYPNLTAERSSVAGNYYCLTFNFWSLGPRLNFTNDIIFDESLWYACVPK